MPRVRGVGWAQSIARFIAIGLVAILPTAGIASATTTVGSTPNSSLIERSHIADAGSSSISVDRGDAHVWPDRSVEQRPDTNLEPARFEGAERADDDAGSIHLVERGESVWKIAEQFGDGTEASTMEIADAILDANLGTQMVDGQRFTNPALIRQGWSLHIPASIGGSATSTISSTSDEAIHPDAVLESPELPAHDESTGGVASDSTGDRYVVVEGDTLSSIADGFLGDADDWPVIFAANEGAEMADGRTLDDPNLLVPGWKIDIPGPDGDPESTAGQPIAEADGAAAEAETPAFASDTDPADPVEPVEPASDAGPDEATVQQSTPVIGDDPVAGEPEVDDQPGADVVETTADPEARSAPTTTTTTTTVTTPAPPITATPTADTPGTVTPSVVSPIATTNPLIPGTAIPMSGTVPPSTTSTTVPAAAQAGDAGSADPRPIESPQAPSPIRLEHAALLAAGVLTLVGVRRSRALRAATPRARVPVRPPDVARTERKLRTIEPGEGAARLDIALRAAAHELAESGAQIGVVRLSTDGHIAFRLTCAGRLEAPWVGIGQDWELPATVPIELLAEAARRAGAPCVALAQIGVDTLGRSVLIDLEAAGLTAVEARAEQADEVIRAIATAVGSSLHSEVAHLVTVSIDDACLLDHPNAHQRRSVQAAIDLALALAGSTTTNDRSTFDLRAMRTSGEMWEPAVVFLDASDNAVEQLDRDSLPQSGHGLAIVCSATIDSNIDAGARIVAHADRWDLLAFDQITEIAPVGLTSEGLDEIAALLDDAAEPIETPTPVFEKSADRVDEPFEVIGHDIVVGLLGGVEVRSATGDLCTFERSKTVELLAWLATHRDRATRTAARTALWELDVRDATFANVVSEARRSLGRLVPIPDGEEWLARTLTESLPLHERVVTDADLVEQRLEHARLSAPAHAIDVLRPAVELIRDMPFAGTSYLWPDADGITSNLVLLATTVTAELAAHALSMGDTETVFWATGHGLRVLPGHEELIALRMRARARAGDLAGVRQEWASYERVIVADAWSDGEPAPKLLQLRRELLSIQS